MHYTNIFSSNIGTHVASQYVAEAPFKLDADGATQTVGFSVRGLKICHQNEWRNMTVELEYDTNSNESSVDTQSVRKYVMEFLNSYPNQEDFWEVMNTKLVYFLVQEFPAIDTLRSKLSLAPDRILSFHRASIAEYDKQKENLLESFGFTKPHYAICNDTFRLLDLHVDFSLKDHPTAADYPDYQWVDRAMEEFFSKHRLSFSKWKDLKPELDRFLLEKFPTLTAINIQLTIAE